MNLNRMRMPLAFTTTQFVVAIWHDNRTSATHPSTFAKGNCIFHWALVANSVSLRNPSVFPIAAFRLSTNPLKGQFVQSSPSKKRPNLHPEPKQSGDVLLAMVFHPERNQWLKTDKHLASLVRLGWGSSDLKHRLHRSTEIWWRYAVKKWKWNGFAAFVQCRKGTPLALGAQNHRNGKWVPPRPVFRLKALCSSYMTWHDYERLDI